MIHRGLCSSPDQKYFLRTKGTAQNGLRSFMVGGNSVKESFKPWVGIRYAARYSTGRMGEALEIHVVTFQGSIFSLLISLLESKSNPADRPPARMQSDKKTISSGINPMKER